MFKIAKFLDMCDNKTTKQQATDMLIKRIEEMNKKMNIPARIDAILEQDIENLAKFAAKEANPLYPVPKLMSAKQLQNVYYMIKE